jgi:hypothetical protein
MQYRSPLFLLPLLLAFGCSTGTSGSGALTPADASDAFADGDLYIDPAYAGATSGPSPEETVAIGSCQYAAPIASLAEQADLGQTGRGLLSIDTADGFVTVQVTRTEASLAKVAAAAYRHGVNELKAPFYGYGIGAAERDAESETFRFAVRNEFDLQAPPTRGIVHLRQDPATGRVIVFTAVWEMSDADEQRDARFLAVAAQQTLHCS